MANKESGVHRRGFGSMGVEKRREICAKGGKAAHLKGTAHEWSREEARAAGRKGGQASRGGKGKLGTGQVSTQVEMTGSEGD